MRSLPFKFFGIFTILLISIASFAQRPKIGLTLSGGGAKGLSHVGILQALDSAGLKVDYITGTSMGSIVGAMYAIGYSGNQIDSITRKLDWEELMSGKPKFTDVGIEEKDEFGQYSFEIPFNGLKPELGTGLIESEEVWLQFLEIFFPVYDEKDFSKFNIPFKCIATDLSTGQAVIIDSGEIVKALRSSMAIPSILSAVEYDSTYLVDGGIVRNFPVSDVRDMGADFVIGVNLFQGLDDASDLNSAMEVMYQITNYRDAYDLVEQKKRCDILIEPPVGEYSAGSFSSANEIFDIGAGLKEKYYPYFKTLADSLNNISKEPFDPYTRLSKKETVIIDDFEVVGLESLDLKTIKQKAGLKIGDTYRLKDINEAFRGLYSTLYFKYAYYELIPLYDNHVIIRIVVKEQPLDLLKIAFSYFSFTTPALFLNYTMRNKVFDKSRSMVKVALSEDMKGLLEHKQFFGHKFSHSTTFSLSVVQQRLPIYDNNILAYQYLLTHSMFDFGYHYYLKKDFALNANLAYRNAGFKPDIASDYRFSVYARDFITTIGFEKNSIDRPFLPQKGMFASGDARLQFDRSSNFTDDGGSLNADSVVVNSPKNPLLRASLKLNHYLPMTSKLTLLTNVQGGAVFSGSNFYFDNVLIGGNYLNYENQFPFEGIKMRNWLLIHFAQA